MYNPKLPNIQMVLLPTVHGPDFNSRHDVQESISKSGTKWDQNESAAWSRGDF